MHSHCSDLDNGIVLISLHSKHMLTSVERLYLSGEIKVLVATSTLAWGVVSTDWQGVNLSLVTKRDEPT